MLQLQVTNETMDQNKKIVTTFEFLVTRIEQNVNDKEDTVSWQ